MKPYPTYKPAGVPWLQQVPEHWVIERAKSVFFGVDVKSKTGKEETREENEHSGLGDGLIRKRLQLLYPDKHELTVTTDNNIYAVYLTISC